MDKWYLQNLESVQENAMHKLFQDFETQADPLILVRRPDLTTVKNKQTNKKTKTTTKITIKKRTCQIVDFAVLADPSVKLKEREKEWLTSRLW